MYKTDDRISLSSSICNFENRLSMTSITVKMGNQNPDLTSDSINSLFAEVLRSTNSWLVWKYLIMPGSIHMLCRPSLVSAISVKKWISFWKKQIEVNWPFEFPVQASNAADQFNWKIYVRKSNALRWKHYMKKPLKQGLVANHEEWPFKGEIYPIETI